MQSNTQGSLCGSIASAQRAFAALHSSPVVALLVRRDDAFATIARLRVRELDDTYASSDWYTALRDRHAFFPPCQHTSASLALADCLHGLQRGFWSGRWCW